MINIPLPFIRREKKTMELRDITELLYELRLPTALVITPTNLEEEKKKFLDSDSYNPQFNYRGVKNKNKKIFKELSGLKSIVDVPFEISDFYLRLIQAKEQTHDFMQSVGHNEELTRISIDRFGFPNGAMFRNSAKILRGYMKKYNIDETSYKKGRWVRYADVKRAFRIIFDELGLDDWDVEKSINIGRNGFKVGMKRQEVLVDENVKKRAHKFKKTLVHELTHVVRGYNGSQTRYDALSRPNLPDYLDTEEGLATFNEEENGYLRKTALKMRAGKIFAIYQGKNRSFRELYNICLGFTTPKNAFHIVYRIKRGLSDTSKPGLYTKDVVYYRGFKKVRRYLKANPEMRKALYVGKISIAQADWLKKGLVPEPKIVLEPNLFKKVFKKLEF